MATLRTARALRAAGHHPTMYFMRTEQWDCRPRAAGNSSLAVAVDAKSPRAYSLGCLRM
jgi:hypothetical protein